tara:strand:+ start:6678 stop:11339 length:4662 start_codon:yes stop_codon:yes gene_type:complete
MLSLVFLPNYSSASNEKTDVSKEQIFKALREEYGPDLEESRLPTIKKVIGDGFRRISIAHAGRFRDVAIHTELHIVDSDEINAIVGSTREHSKSRIKNIAVLTTGILRFFFKDIEGQEDFQVRVNELIGILAHELGHTVDQLDRNGIENHYTSKANQAVEIRADAEATEILQAAKLDPNYLVSALRRLLSLPLTGFDPLFAGTSTHPETFVRISSLELKLSLDKITKGSRPIEQIVFTPETVATAMQEVNRELTLRSGIELPNNLESLRRLLSEKKELSAVELNAWLIWFDRYIEKYPDIDTKGTYDLVEIVKLFSVQTKFVCDSSQCLKKLFENINVLRGFETVPHKEYVQKLPFFKTDLYSVNEYGRSLATFGKFIHPELVKSYLEKDNSVAIEFWKSFSKSPSDMLSQQSLTEYFGWVQLFFDSYFENLRKPIAIGNTSRFDFFGLLPSDSNKSIWSLALLLKNKNPELGRIARSAMQEIWNNRGFWAFIELNSEVNNRFDWMFIAKELGIDKSVVGSSVQKSLIEFLDQHFESLPDFEQSQFFGQRYSVKSLFSVNKRKPFWITESLSQKFERVLEKIRDQKVKAKYSELLFSSLSVYYPNISNKRYETKLTKELNRSDLAELSTIQKIKTRAVEIWNLSTGIIDKELRVYNPIWIAHTARVIANSKIDSVLKADFIRYLAFGVDDLPKELPTVPFAKLPDQFLPEFYQLLREYGIITDIFDLMAKIAQLEKKSFIKFKNFESESSFDPVEEDRKNLLVKLGPIFYEELKERVSKETSLRDFKKIVFEVSRWFSYFGKKNEFGISPKISGLLVEKLKEFTLSPSESLALFYRITRIGTNETTDRYFKDNILPQLENSGRVKIIQSVLAKDLINSESLKTDLAAVVVKNNLSLGMDLFDVSSLINKLLPKDSLYRDAYLESIGWDHDLTGPFLKGHVEDEKSSNWRRMTPYSVNVASTVSSYVQTLNSTLRLEFLDFVVRAEKGSLLPNSIYDYLKRDLIEKLSPDEKVNEFYIKKIDRTLYGFKVQIEKFLGETNPAQRVPIILAVATHGSNSLYGSTSLMEYLIQKYLGVAPNSEKFFYIKTYLELLDPSEKNVVFSYLLANSGGSVETVGKNSSIASLLKLFGPIGIKFGQLAAVWNIFGAEHQDALEELYHKAPAMSKYDVENELNKSITKSFFEQNIKLKKVLGSASIKTVVLSQYKDGPDIAIMLKRPYASGQIDASLDLAKKFLARLKAQGVEFQSPLFGPMVAAIEAEIAQETNFKIEVENYKIADRVVNAIQMNKKTERQTGWKFSVPKVIEDFPVNESLFAVEAVAGVSLKDYLKDATVSEFDKKQVVELVTEMSLDMLFEYGYFDPDRHPGNWIIDKDSKKIYFIDAGKLTNFSAKKSKWKWDPRLTLASFLKALHSRSINELVHYASLMTESGTVSPESKEKAKNLIKKLSDETLEINPDFLKTVVEIFYKSGFDIDHLYTFGALKGLMVLNGKVDGKPVVEPKTFARLIEKSVRRLLIGKLPAIGIEKASTGLRQLIGNQNSKRRNSSNTCLGFYSK